MLLKCSCVDLVDWLCTVLVQVLLSYSRSRYTRTAPVQPISILTSISSVKWWGSGVRLEHFLSPPKNIWNQRFFGSSILQWSHFGCYIYVVLAWTPILQMILDYYLGPYMCWYIEPGSWFYRAPTDRYISKAHITDTIGRSADQCRRWLKRWQVALSKCLRNNSKESKRKQN